MLYIKVNKRNEDMKLPANEEIKREEETKTWDDDGNDCN